MKISKQIELAVVRAGALQLIADYRNLMPQAATPPAPSMAQELVTLNSTLTLLGKAFSKMVVRNLLADILRLLIKLDTYDLTPKASNWAFAVPSPRGTGPVIGNNRKVANLMTAAKDKAAQPVQAAKALNKNLRDLVELRLKAHSPSKARYDRVLCLGFKVQCAPDDYEGDTVDRTDMLDKVEKMKKAIRAAYTLADTMGNYNADSKVLKVFMAPEFYFRGINGAYTHADVLGQEAQPSNKLPAIKSLIEEMALELNQPIYKDWLFVLGTAIAATELTETKCSQCAGPVSAVGSGRDKKLVFQCSKDATHKVTQVSHGAQIDNIAFVYKEGKTHYVTKELVSRIDFLADDKKPLKDKVKIDKRTLSVQRVAQPSGYTSAEKKATSFQDERMGGCIFTLDGITYGLEVCLDHAATGPDKSAGRLNHAANIQIQLIPSAGMSIKKLRTVPNGIVFNVDGLTPHVQVIGGGTKGSIDFGKEEWSFKVDNWADLAKVGTNMDDTGGATTLKKLTGIQWQKVTTTNHVTSASGGSVLGYGPFDIPTI